MKIPRSLYWFTVAIAVLIALVIWFGKGEPVKTPPASLLQTNAAQPTATTSGQPASARVRSTASPGRVAAGAAGPSRPDKAGQIKEGLADLNDVRIIFYGKLEDQFGNPVAGAQIAGNTIVYNGVRGGAEHVLVTSDAYGLFEIDAGRGESLGVMPHKEGYALATTRTEFKYSYMYGEHFTPDPNNPVVFKMWKLQGAEPLMGIGQRYKLHITDTPVNFDLITGKIVPSGGDIRIIVARPTGTVSQRQMQDWGLMVEAVDGGLIETTFAEARVTYQAPEGDYQPSLAIAVTTTNHWSDLAQLMFFVKSRGGKVYSKVFLSFNINESPDSPALVTFRGVANTNGSGNWEATAN